MKSKLFILILIMSVVFISCNNKDKKETTTDPNAVETTKSENLKLQVYYFFSAHRCPSCNSIEENVKTVMNTKFSEEIKDGKVAISYLNIEDEANKAIVEKLQVYGSSLFLIQYKNKEEIVHDLTEYAFTYSRKQPEVFKQGITDTIKSYIN
jgi:thioredoxin-related protein